jgi:Flp pilus assembly protein TadG
MIRTLWRAMPGRPGEGRRDDDGAAAVEFALVVVPLILIVFGIIAFGIVFAQQLALNNSAREAARWGVVRTVDGGAGRDCRDILATARTAASAIGMTSGNVGVTVSRGGSTLCSVAAGTALPASGTGYTTRPCVGSGSGTSDQLEVITTYRSTVVVPLLPLPVFDLRGAGVFRCEYST